MRNAQVVGVSNEAVVYIDCRISGPPPSRMHGKPLSSRIMTLEAALHSSTSTVRSALIIASSLMLAGGLYADDPFGTYHYSIDLKL